MTKQRRKTFTIALRGRKFPLDMLRHDCAWPATSTDTDVIAKMAERGGISTVVLQSDSARAPTAGRWNSFGCVVVGGADRGAAIQNLARREG